MKRKGDSPRLIVAYEQHLKSQRGIQAARQRVDNFLRHLFTALKDQEIALANYTKTARKLQKIRGPG